MTDIDLDRLVDDLHVDVVFRHARHVERDEEGVWLVATEPGGEERFDAVLTGGPLGLMQAALDAALPYVRERRQFDQAIGSFGIMQAKIADMYAALQSSRAFAYMVAKDYDAGHTSRAGRPSAHGCLWPRIGR